MAPVISVVVVMLLLTVDNSTSLLLNGEGSVDAGWLSSWHGMVTVAGIAFAVVLVFMTLTFLCYHRVHATGTGRARAKRPPRTSQVGQVGLRYNIMQTVTGVEVIVENF